MKIISIKGFDIETKFIKATDTMRMYWIKLPLDYDRGPKSIQAIADKLKPHNGGYIPNYQGETKNFYRFEMTIL